MTLKALILFGSHARLDAIAESDIDVLGISDDAVFQSVSFGLLNISIYPINKFLLAASQGDLFCLHIIMEGKKIHDPEEFLSESKKIFKVKSNYIVEIEEATDLGWVLLGHCDEIKDIQLLNRRMAWCVRTILIAKSVENGNPVFSAKALEELSGSGDVGIVLNNKSSIVITSRELDAFRSILMKHGKSRESVQGLSLLEARKVFKLREARVAQKTVEALLTSSAMLGYS